MKLNLKWLNPKRLIDKIWEDEFKISLFVLGVAFLVVNLPTILSGRYLEKEFLDSMLSNANSMILDILVILCLTTYLIKKSEKRREIQRLKDEIDDFRGWESEEASHRIRGIIFRLNKLGITQITLTNCHLENADLIYANLAGADLRGAKLHEADLRRANLGSSDLRGADLHRSNFEGANLSYAKLAWSQIDKTNFKKADIRGIQNISGMQGLDAAYFTDAIMDDETREFLSKINPTVKPLEKPVGKNSEGDKSA